MNTHLCIFDLDGTLIDSQVDLANSVNATRAWAGLDPLPMAQVASYVGNGAPMLVRRALPDADDQLLEEFGSARFHLFQQIIRERLSKNSVSRFD